MNKETMNKLILVTSVAAATASVVYAAISFVSSRFCNGTGDVTFNPNIPYTTESKECDCDCDKKACTECKNH